MSLLWMEYETDFQDLVNIAFQCEQDAAPDYFSKLSDYTRKIIYRDTRYNIDFLYTSYVLQDEKIMTDYAKWLFLLLDSVFKENTKEQTARYVINHFDKIGQAVSQRITDSGKQQALLELISLSQKNIQEISLLPDLPVPAKTDSAYEPEIQEYMDSLLQKDMRKTLTLIQQFLSRQIPLNDIYVEILAESMKRVGDLWHTARISVDTEHYCTSVTQTAMAQLYPLLFTKPRKGKLLLCACPGTELHEMGARMVADIFENDGWDTIYLGAAVPTDAMLCSIRENHPDLIALSVTMPQHLLECQALIHAIRREFPDIKIAVGGHAFSSTHSIWKQWPVDFYTEDARELLRQVNESETLS